MIQKEKGRREPAPQKNTRNISLFIIDFLSRFWGAGKMGS